MRSRLVSQLLALLIVFAVMASSASAVTYYVRADGNDANAGTGSSAALAWATVTAASTKPLLPGDIIYVQAGIYSGPIEPTVDGTSGNPITFVADRTGSVSGWSSGDVIIQAPVGEHGLDMTGDDYLTFSDFQFKGDSGRDSVDIDTGTGAVLQRCEIYGGYIGVDIDDADVTIINCLVRDNASDGINLDIGTLVVSNSTVVNNVNDGIFISAGTLTVTNCIIANNSGDGFDVNGGTLTHTYNLVYGSGDLDYEGTSTSTGEISVDPQFVSATDYHITMLSPAKDAGTDLSGTVDDDLEGRARPAYGVYDIGCYEEGPIAYWKLDETSGTVAADSSGFSHDGTISGNPSWSTTAIRGGSLDLETTDGADHVDAGNFDVTGSGLTLTAWIRQEDPLNDGRIIMKSSSNAGSDQSWGLTIDENGELDFRVTAGGSWDRIQAAAVISSSTWHHIAGTYDGTTMRLYLDGQLITTKAHSSGGAIVGNSSHTVTLGDSSIGSRPFDGIIDDARIYSRNLSDEEIAALYDENSLVGHWKLDETSGTTAVDSSGRDNDGTVNGTATWTSAIYGNGLDLNYIDGDDYVEIPNSPSLENVQEENYTVAAWFKPGSTPPGSGADFDAHYGIVIKEGWHTGLSYTNANQFQMDHFLSGDVWAGTGTWDTSYPPGKFYHVAGVIDRSAGTVKIYVDGELVYSDSFTPGAASNELGTESWRIGIAGPSYSDWKWAADGMVDDARIYSRALSDTEIKELYGLMGHWKLDETSGTVATDSSGLGNDGTYVNGPVLGNCGPYESSVEFNMTDTNDRVDLPHTALDDVMDASVVFWIKTAKTGQAAVLSGADAGNNNEFIAFFSSDTQIYLYKHNASYGFTIPSVADDQWTHFALTWKGNTNLVTLYRNGQLVGSGTMGGTTGLPINIDPGGLMLAQEQDNVGGGFDATQIVQGSLDDVQIYDRALTAMQVADLYGLMGHWKLDETSGTVAADATVFGNDGTYTNGTALNYTGKIDIAAKFDGADDYVGITDDSTLQVDNVFSMSMWIKADSSTNIDRMIINKEGEYEVALSASNEIKWGITNTDPGWSWHSTGHLVANNVWVHIAVTYDYGTVRTYANGALVDTYYGSGSVGDQYTSLNEVRLGGRSNNPTGKYFDGLIDDVRIYKRVLCLDEVLELSGGGVNGIRIIKWVETL